MNRRTFLSSGLAAICLALPILKAHGLENKAKETDKTQKSNSQESKPTEYTLIEKYIQIHCTHYVEAISPYSPEMQKNTDAKANGDKEKGKAEVVKGYVQLHRFCLDLALAHKKQSISDSEFEKLGQNLAKHQITSSFDPPFKETPELIKGYEVWGRERTLFFKKLLKADEEVHTDIDDELLDYSPSTYEELVTSRFSRKEYAKYLENQAKGLDAIYTGMAKSFRTGIHELFGKSQVFCVLARDKEFNQRSLEEIFGKEKGK